MVCLILFPGVSLGSHNLQSPAHLCKTRYFLWLANSEQVVVVLYSSSVLFSSILHQSAHVFHEVPIFNFQPNYTNISNISCMHIDHISLISEKSERSSEHSKLPPLNRLFAIFYTTTSPATV